MDKTKSRDRNTADQLKQLELQFPGLTALLEAKTLDNAIYPPKKQSTPAVVTKESERQA